MSIITDNLAELKSILPDDKITLVAVTKTHPVEKIMELYETGQRDFGENRVQELLEKKDKLPADIRWHLIGHLQRNKVKFIAPFVYMIHSVDSLKLLEEINREAEKNGRIINCLLQVYVATEETKFGLDYNELVAILDSGDYKAMINIKLKGIMGMATMTDDEEQVHEEFALLKKIFDSVKSNYFAGDNEFRILSMGMSSDYRIAIEEGSTMLRLGSVIFGERHYIGEIDE